MCASKDYNETKSIKFTPKCKNEFGRDYYEEQGKIFDFCSKTCVRDHEKNINSTSVFDFFGLFNFNRCGCVKECQKESMQQKDV